MEHGKYTAELGRALRSRLESSVKGHIRVYFDHGSRGQSNRIVPYFGEYKTSTTLAFVDLAIVDTETSSVLVLCEIEEEGANPKKVIGDVLNVFLSESVCVEGRRYDASCSHFLLGAKVDRKGNSAEKICRLRERIEESIKEESRKGIVLEFVTAFDHESLVHRLETRICEIVGFQQANDV